MPPATCYDFPLLKDEVSAIVQDAVLSTLEGNVYDHSKVTDWINIMTNSCVDDLQKLSPNFKYIVTCLLRQRKGAGLELSSTAYWDEKADGAFVGMCCHGNTHTGACTVSWENSSISVVIFVYGLAI
ncbi:TPA: hypothetical protein N0F65_001133 [Lagenidium giganteum]|uniref:Dynein light chain Tctex-type n=1 Tax=Lagenidium giganteum TaxID=4803 RepID=A0AAV2YUT7_9STRA|nr:TPA: hypothetical protein N0F65_001133 [Lagenidium giganteum]